ncbi:MAG TPA: ATP-binding cassette domain-containing protein, partial [Candidatus Limnocylindrales bacterium]
MSDGAAASAAASPAVEVTGLVKRYDGRAVVERIDLTVRQTSVIAILGPNGAGKTTMLEILEGYRHADEGEVRVLGLDPWTERSALRSRVGLMLQRADLYNQIRVLEAVRLFADFYVDPLSPGMVLEQVGLAARANDRYRTLS